MQPPLAYVGYTEEEAVAKCSGDIDVYVSKFKPMKNTISLRDERTFMKLIVHAQTDQVGFLPRTLPVSTHFAVLLVSLLQQSEVLGWSAGVGSTHGRPRLGRDHAGHCHCA